jgi:hypothetical protein
VDLQPREPNLGQFAQQLDNQRDGGVRCVQGVDRIAGEMQMTATMRTSASQERL